MVLESAPLELKIRYILNQVLVALELFKDTAALLESSADRGQPKYLYSVTFSRGTLPIFKTRLVA
jgi:hypothetical protein